MAVAAQIFRLPCLAVFFQVFFTILSCDDAQLTQTIVSFSVDLVVIVEILSRRSSSKNVFFDVIAQGPYSTM
jgi:hypothetical protein